MAATLTYGATTITLVPQTPKKSEINLQVEKDTLGGYRRLSLVWRKYVYEMTLEPLATTDYDAIRDMHASARTAGSFLTFAWPEWWPETTGGVSVVADLGAQDNVYGAYVATTLKLTETSPR